MPLGNKVRELAHLFMNPQVALLLYKAPLYVRNVILGQFHRLGFHRVDSPARKLDEYIYIVSSHILQCLLTFHI